MPVHDWTRVTPVMFHDFHGSWITHLKEALNGGLLPESYFAASEQSASEAIPDVLTLQASDGAGWFAGESELPAGAVAIAEAPPKVSLTVEAESEICVDLQRTVVIRHSSNDRIVALIEIVSPGNKQSRMRFDDFLRKVASAIKSGYHLLIIDLFPPGKHDPAGIHGAIWEYIEGNGFEQPADRPLTLAAYKAGLVPTAYVEPIAVGSELPEMPLCLNPAYYVNVPLEVTYRQSWAGFPARWKNLMGAE
jgi:Protein of unknown function (DUF4058)